MPRRIADLLTERSSRRVVGREAELALLDELLQDDGPIVAFVHGIAGIGKTTLVRAFAQRARALGAVVLEIDGADVEPSAKGFRLELATALGVEPGSGSGRELVSSQAQIDARLVPMAGPVIITIDAYERLRLIDGWVRRDFVPGLAATCRVLIAGRDRPLMAWEATFGRAGALLDIALGGLPETDALTLLELSNLDDAAQRDAVRLTRGHPLALQMVASSPKRMISARLDETRSQFVREIANAHVDDLPAATRTVVEAASVVRRATKSLLRVMTPSMAPGEAFDLLAALPFVTRTQEGLALHDLVHDVVQAALRADDPESYRRYRRAAWEQLTAEARSVGASSLWRYTADMLALIDNPVVREAFFPATTEFLAVEPARPGDADSIKTLAAATDPVAASDAIGALWDSAPECFVVVRDADAEVCGFYIVCRSDQLSSAVIGAHPLMRQWRDHLRNHPVARDEIVLFMPRWLSRRFGEAPCAAQAASWLDVKRLYMELRPRLRRLYTTVIDLGRWAPVVVPLGFAPLPELSTELDGVTFHTALLDFGPGSVDGWLATRVAGELGIADRLLDPDDRTVRTDEGRTELTRLEYGVMELLLSRPGVAISRRQLLASVWGSDYAEGSNVVDAVVRTLRRKLGGGSQSIESVRGIGYRLIV